MPRQAQRTKPGSTRPRVSRTARRSRHRSPQQRARPPATSHNRRRNKLATSGSGFPKAVGIRTGKGAQSGQADQAERIQVHVEQAQGLPVVLPERNEQYGQQGENQAAQGHTVPAPAGMRLPRVMPDTQGNPVDQNGCRHQIRSDSRDVNQRVRQPSPCIPARRPRQNPARHWAGGPYGIEVAGARQHRDKMHHGREDQRHDADGERQMRNRQAANPSP